jgi:hypothetical protein
MIVLSGLGTVCLSRKHPSTKLKNNTIKASKIIHSHTHHKTNQI